MSRRSGALISATITLVVFVVIPLYVPSRLPPHFIDMINAAGLDVSSFTSQLSVIGAVVAVTTLVKGFVEPSSPLYLLTTLASSVVTFAFTIVTLSFGNLEALGNMGLTTMTADVQGIPNIIVLDFRIFVQLAAVAVLLKMLEAILEYMDARKEASLSPVAPPTGPEPT